MSKCRRIPIDDAESWVSGAVIGEYENCFYYLVINQKMVWDLGLYSPDHRHQRAYDEGARRVDFIEANKLHDSGWHRCL